MVSLRETIKGFALAWFLIVTLRVTMQGLLKSVRSLFLNALDQALLKSCFLKSCKDLKSTDFNSLHASALRLIVPLRGDHGF